MHDPLKPGATLFVKVFPASERLSDNEVCVYVERHILANLKLNFSFFNKNAKHLLVLDQVSL